MTDYSDFIIYADESGSPVLGADIDDFPVFVLVFMLVSKRHYAEQLVPKVQMLKFDSVGHDQLILHERDIRRQSKDFAFLQVSEPRRNAFLERLNTIIGDADIELCCAIIDKSKLQERYNTPWDPYALALTFCLERAAQSLARKRTTGHEVSVIFEARGAKEDRLLELEFRRIASGAPRLGKASAQVKAIKWKPRFADKRSNSTGLQLADLVARPLGLHYLRPSQPNRAAEIARRKISNGGPKCFP
ncbi:MAG: DUF3800 domain-containing protein [Paracoccus sp. (in: a-proteobacteria)]|uniref:DUF3800 domain-containing protein n=1 Tax=Paracoccus sp. TaxID=267 RepID=UPI0026DFC907|nr:DUF3800 domain-containing protein [Paracoccus sp. (in: a-proteobacteria)]MDO5622557.1 DUF3800 domain-containing protein [Paracoccus sp. (in: a-proteobacteria)]